MYLLRLHPRQTAASIWLVALSLLLSACSNFSSRPPSSGQLGAMQGNQSLQQWQFSGKVGLRGEQLAESAYLNWTQCSQNYAIKLSGPLGTGAAQLYGIDGETILWTSDEQLRSRDPEQLMTERLGWSIPVAQMHYWLRGLPDPHLRYQLATADTGFTQAGWRLTYPRISDVEQYPLPAKIIASHPQLKVTVLIQRWQLAPDCQTPLYRADSNTP